MKIRSCTRIKTQFPVIFAGENCVGEGTVVNVSVPGCEISSRKMVELGSYLEMKVLLPDRSSSLTVGLARVRWRQGHRFGVEFIKMAGEDQVRLGRMVKQHVALFSSARLRSS
jgi:hypothetical protein